MTSAATLSSAGSKALVPARVTAWLYLLFFLSGISGLMDEVVWVRMLSRILGNTVYATSTILAAFMAGLALGSLLVGRFVDRSRAPLLLYAALELGIGLTAMLSLGLVDWPLPIYRALYSFAEGSRSWLTAGQVGLSLASLLVPTALMGATLPTLCAFGARRHQENFGRCVGTLYSLNALGAMVGVAASGFVLIGMVGETWTLAIAACINGVVAAGALLLAARERASRNAEPLLSSSAVEIGEQATGPDRSPLPVNVRRIVTACFAVSGLVALANEVIWSRMLVLYQGTSIYSFSAMLVVMLAGMGVGSLVVGRFIDRWRDPLRLLARLEIGLGLAGALSLVLFDQLVGGMMLAPLVLISPIGLLGGCTFPVAARCVSGSRTEGGQTIAVLYSWNTVGCIAGALIAGFVLIPLLGSSRSIAFLSGLSALTGLVLVAAHPQGLRRATGQLEVYLLAGCGLLLVVAGDPYLRVLQQRIERASGGHLVIYRHIEEAAATTTAFGPPMRTIREGKHLWVNGMGMTHMGTVTKLMAHLPIWLADDPHDILVICFGMGTTLRSASRHEGMQLWAVELVPGVLRCFDLFHPDSLALLQQPNVHAVCDDGRNFLLMRSQFYDVITIDPAPPVHSAGTVNLYSREFFQLCRQHIRPGGVVCLWVPPSGRSEVKLILRTFLEAFPYVSAWSGPPPDTGIYLIGTLKTQQDYKIKIRQAFHPGPVLEDLVEWGTECDRPEKILDLYVADKPLLETYLAETPAITDDLPYTEFPLLRALFREKEYDTVLNAPTLRYKLRAMGSPN